MGHSHLLSGVVWVGSPVLILVDAGGFEVSSCRSYFWSGPGGWPASCTCMLAEASPGRALLLAWVLRVCVRWLLVSLGFRVRSCRWCILGLTVSFEGMRGSEELKPHWWSPTLQARLRVVAHFGPAVETGVVIYVTVSRTLASARPSGVDGVHSGRAEGMHRINLPACRPARDCMVHGV
jgi:hypothetical protein